MYIVNNYNTRNYKVQIILNRLYHLHSNLEPDSEEDLKLPGVSVIKVHVPRTVMVILFVCLLSGNVQ